MQQGMPPPGRDEFRQDNGGLLAIVMLAVGHIQVIQQWLDDRSIGGWQHDQRDAGIEFIPFFLNRFRGSRVEFNVDDRDIPGDPAGES